MQRIIPVTVPSLAPKERKQFSTEDAPFLLMETLVDPLTVSLFHQGPDMRKERLVLFCEILLCARGRTSF